MKVCCLGSGSAGNAVLIEVEGTRVLVDAGFSARSLEGRLASVGLEPGSTDAILITHDHGDHTRGVGVFARRHGTPVYITERTLEACRNLFPRRRADSTLRSRSPVPPWRTQGRTVSHRPRRRRPRRNSPRRRVHGRPDRHRDRLGQTPRQECTTRCQDATSSSSRRTTTRLCSG